MDDPAGLLADAIKRHNGEIVRVWLEQIQADVDRAGRKVELTDLRDGVADYLDRLAESLRRDTNGDAGGAHAWKEVAREHAVTRVRLGFDIEQLVHEFIVLRRSTMKVLGDHDVEFDGRRASLLADLIEAAVATSVRSYVDSRDYQARKQEAEHIGFVTHELRNPLTTAMLAATQLQNDAELASRYRPVLTLLGKGLQKMKDLIESLLLTERLEAGSVPARVRDVRIDAVMEESLRAARAEARKKGLEFVARYDPQLMVRADPGLTTSALQNLVDNAVKFTDAGKIEITVEGVGAEVIFHVRDTCSGLSPEELATIFEPFRRGHTGKPGTGLGLAIASRAVRAQGGRLQAESGHEDGCHFWITLPKAGA